MSSIPGDALDCLWLLSGFFCDYSLNKDKAIKMSELQGLL